MTNRDITVKEIKAGLRRRSNRTWSVTVGRGTDWGWITISAPPRRMVGGCMTDEDQAELSRLLAKTVHCQGETVPASSDYYREYVDRANGAVCVAATPYWD